MSCVIIYPMELSPVPLSDPPETHDGQPYTFSIRSCFGWVYMAFSVTRETVVSTLPFHPYQEKPGGISLLHYPWSHLRRTLSGTLPCEARTFLTWPPPRSCQPRLHILLLSKRNIRTVNNHTTNSLSCPSPNRRSHKAIQNSLSHIKAASPQTPAESNSWEYPQSALRQNNPKTSAAALPPGIPALPPQSGTKRLRIQLQHRKLIHQR